ncbi:MAG TPA: DMT family transporter [Ktedonobacterales bacterium]|nr:DMT family transporter [Ktedonobacterales bacterium]
MTVSATSSAGAARAIGQPRLSRGGAFGLLVLANALWAGTYTAGKIALSQLSPVELNAVRFSLATLMLAPVLVRGWRQIPRDRATLVKLGQLTLLGFVLNKAFEYFGLNLSTASDVALLIATESIFTALLSWTFLRERVSGSGVAALALGLFGAYLIVERGFLPNLGGGGNETARIAGDLLVVLSLFLEAGYTVRGKTALASMPPLLFTATTLAGSLFVWLPAGAVAVAQSGWPHVTLAGWLAVLYMAAIATVAGYWLWFRALTRLDASAAAPTLFIQPLLGAALAIWLLHDRLTWATLLGGALIGASLLLVVRSSRQPSAPPIAIEAP